MASAVQVRNFKSLLEAAGTVDDLALALDMPLQRINELLRGENFPRESAHHIEETLQLPSGFLDRMEARVAPNLFDQLKESWRAASSEPKANVTTLQTSPLTRTIETGPNASNATLLTSGIIESPDPAQPRPSVSPSAPDAGTVPDQAVAGPHRATRRAIAAGRDLQPNGVLDTRHANLAMLTQVPGTKGKLGQLMGMSPANISHRIHKNKKLDDAEIQRLTKVLHLPPDWFDSPRTTQDVPHATRAMLTPEPKTPRRAGKNLPARTLISRDAVPSDPLPVPNDPSKSLPMTSMPAYSVDADGALVHPHTPATAYVTAELVAAQASPATPGAQANPVAVRAQVAVDASTSTVLLTLGDEDGMGPIARALLHTVFLKARAGDLDELTALRLLHDVAAL